MPELPEVETIRLGLSKKIIGLKIKTITILNPKTFIGDAKKLQGKNVLDVWRKAKILGIDLSGNLSLLLHLKMSGQIILIQNSKFKIQNYNAKLKTDDKFIGGHPTKDMVGELPNESTRIIFEFNDRSKLYFNDQRKFGWIRLVDSGQVTADSFLSKLGPEPLEKGFTWQILKSNLLRHKSLPVKVAIMDQTIVAGVGNIYASEACFLAGIDPRTKVGQLTDRQFQRLHQGIVEALKMGLKYGGSTRAHFVNSEGKKGYFLDYAYVYGRAEDLCKVCGNVIEKIQLAGRGTYLCSNCQHSVQY